MKEVKQFVDMMEYKWSDYHELIKTSEFKALKVLLDKPVVKENLITDEMIDLAYETYNKYKDDDSYYDGMKAALEAALAPIGRQDSHIPPERPLKEPEQATDCLHTQAITDGKTGVDCDECGGYWSLQQWELKQYTRSMEQINSNPKPAVFDEQSADTQDNDGWIEWKGGECPVENYVNIEVKYRNSDYGFYNSWMHTGSKYDIIAYRIIPEAKEQVDCHHPSTSIRELIKGGDICLICKHEWTEKKEPQKQTFVEFLSEKDVYKVSITAIELACWFSEYLEQQDK